MLLCKQVTNNYPILRLTWNFLTEPKWNISKRDIKLHSTQHLEDAYRKMKAKCQCNNLGLI